ncbi:MAG: ATP-grasp domain-containing protein [Clostridiales bacterium]|nr:ATP-grasp domain-containing protein [Clostridiales bacterium]
MQLKGKKLLILGGKPIGSCEIVEYAKSKGVYTIVTDYLPIQESPAKQIADEAWQISTAELALLKQELIKNKVDGIYAGVHEFNIKKMIELCQEMDLPCFCSIKQWDFLNNKHCFKDLCRRYDIPVTKEYTLSNFSDPAIKDIEFPVVVKPVDGSGSRGFSICKNIDQLKIAYNEAISFSATKKVLIEKYMNYEKSVIINYTLVDGQIFFSGISDKTSKKVFKDGAPVMAVQFYQSLYKKEYLDTLDKKVQKMFKEFGLKNGVIWIEAFCEKGEFTFNEMGFRFGGSLTYLPVEYFYDISQLELQIEYALTGKYSFTKNSFKEKSRGESYCILPIHVNAGRISQIINLDEIKDKKYVNKIVPVHFMGDKIDKWGSAQQVFAYLHLVGKDREEIDNHIDEILKCLSIKDENNNEMLFNLYKD